MEGTSKQIEDFLIENKFIETTSDDNEIKYTKTFKFPGKQLIVNGELIRTQEEERDFIITYLGEGAILDIDNVPVTSLYGYNMAGNDIWVESLEDFKFWFTQIFR